MNYTNHLADSDLAKSAGAIFFTEQMAEPWTKEIARRTTAIMVKFYPEVYEQMIEHVVSEALTQFSFHLRQGYPVALESLGTLMPIDYQGKPGVVFEPFDILTMPIATRPRNATQLNDRRRAKGGNRA